MPESPALCASLSDPNSGTAVINFRELGGMTGAAGRRVRARMLFRSAQPDYRTRNTVGLLAGQGIRAVCDFRSDPERSDDPSLRMEEHGLTYLAPNAGRQVGDPVTTLLRATIDPATTHEMMHEVYSGIAFSQQESFTRLFALLLEAPGPVLFHCASGKDRTGAFAALLLTVLGVPRAAIKADFAASGAAIAEITRLFSEDPRHAAMIAAPAPVWAPMMEANPAYLATFYATLEDQFGSLLGFVEQGLGVGPREQEALRRIYLD